MYDVNTFRNLYRRQKRGLGVTSSIVRVSLKPIKAKTLRVITHLTAENQTSDFTKVRIGISNRGIEYYLDELINVASDELAISRSDILLGDGDVLFVEFTGTTTGDVLVMTSLGWEMAL